MTTQHVPPPPIPSQDRVTDEWLGSHLPSVFVRGHRYNLGLLRETSDAIISAAGIRPGFHVVDIAAGSGIPTLAIARLVGPGGRVTAVDPSPVFVDALTRNAREAGLDNVDIVQASVTAMPFETASFDAATCHFGAMFFPDLHAGLEAIRRVLRPGRRAAFAAWGPIADNTLFGTFFPTLARHLGPQPPPDNPTEAPWPMRFAEPGTLAAALARAGFEDTREERPVVDMTWPGPARSLHEFWMDMANLGEDVPAGTRRAIEDDLLAALERVEDADGLHFTARVVIASGRNLK